MSEHIDSDSLLGDTHQQDREETIADAETLEKSIETNVENEKTVATGIDTSETSSPEYSFEFELPKDGLALQSVAIVNGKPQLSSVASPKVPTITQEDVAIICKLTSKGIRPGFCFHRFPEGHPFFGRQYKGYHPASLRGTSVGDLMFEADWKMKCLHVGTKSDEEKSVFFSWKKYSNLKGLGTRLDFPKDVKPVGQFVYMHCESVEVYRAEDGNSLEFIGDPVITITDETNSLYTKYISEIFPSVAYHDEPVFLKMQELSKLILACEWLKEKGVKMSQKWMSKYYCDTGSKPHSQGSSPAIEEEQSLPPAQKTKKPPYEMIPKPTVVKIPSNDVTVQTREAVQYRRLSECGVSYFHGYCDGGELVLCTEDGDLVTRQQCMKTFFKKTTTVGGQKVGEMMMWMNLPIPFPKFSTLEPAMMKSVNEECDKHLPPESNEAVVGPIGPMTIHTKGDKAITDDLFQLSTTTTAQPHPPLLPMQETVTMKATGDDYDMLYDEFIPPDSIPVGFFSHILPNVKSWSELHRESVPWPRIFQVPYTGIGEAAPSGGVSTHHLTEVPTSRPRKSPVVQETRSETAGQYVRNGQHFTVQGMRQPSNATIRLANSDEFADVARKFTQDWTKGPCPTVASVFVVTNGDRERKWVAYRQGLRVKDEEWYYHGTTLGCNIPKTRQLCRFPHCGVCGISSEGLDKNCIRQKVDFQRFGPGFYLAPHSSKCHDYTEGNRESGYRAMLLCKVLPGHKYHLTETKRKLQGPPPGYNSIYGQIGIDLNYPEIVLTNPDAVIVRYIILYRKDGVDHPLSR